MIVRQKVFIQCQTCEIRINNYMKHGLEFSRANHGTQPSLDLVDMVQNIYGHMSQKGMSVIMEHTCQEARN